MAETRILLIAGDPSTVEAVQAAVDGPDVALTVAKSAGEGLTRAEESTWDVAFVAVDLPDVAGTDLVGRLVARPPAPTVVALVPAGAEASGLAAVRAGAHTFLERPRDLSAARVRTVLAEALGHRALVERVDRLERGALAAGGLPTLELAELERVAIRRALEVTAWNKQRAARLLGLHRPTLYAKMRKHAIPQQRPSPP